MSCEIPLPDNRMLHSNDLLELITITEKGLLVRTVLDTYQPENGETWDECKVRAGLEIQQKYGAPV